MHSNIDGTTGACLQACSLRVSWCLAQSLTSLGCNIVRLADFLHRIDGSLFRINVGPAAKHSNLPMHARPQRRAS